MLIGTLKLNTQPMLAATGVQLMRTYACCACTTCQLGQQSWGSAPEPAKHAVRRTAQGWACAAMQRTPWAVEPKAAIHMRCLASIVICMP